MQTNACGPLAAAIFARAGWAAGRASADARVQDDSVKGRVAAGGGQQRVGLGPLPGHHDLGGAQPEIDGIEQRHVHVEIFRGRRCDRGDQSVGFVAPAVVAGQDRKPDEILRGDRVVVRSGLIGGRGGADDQTFGVGGGEIISSGLGIGVIAVERAAARSAPDRDSLLAGASYSASAARIMAAKSDARPGNLACPSRQE